MASISGLEEPVGAAAVGLGAVHRKVGAFQQLVEIGTVMRRQSDADTGVAGDMVPEALIRLADRIVDPLDQLHGVARSGNAGLDDGEFVAAEPGHEIGVPHAVAQAARDGLEQFVADGMAERIVDALELVDVDIEHRELLAAPLDALKLALEPLAEQHAVRQIGQRVVMRQMRDLPLGAPALGNVFLGRDPSAALQRLVARSRSRDRPAFR